MRIFYILYIIVLYIMNEHTKKYYLNRLTNQCQERTSEREQHKPVLEHSSWLNDLLWSCWYLYLAWGLWRQVCKLWKTYHHILFRLRPLQKQSSLMFDNWNLVMAAYKTGFSIKLLVVPAMYLQLLFCFTISKFKQWGNQSLLYLLLLTST